MSSDHSTPTPPDSSRGVASSPQSLFFDYELPEHLVAQHPAPERDSSRLLVVRRAGSELEHRTFRDLPELLNPGDRLVLNDTRVIPARLLGKREKTGGRWEGLFLREVAPARWEMMTHTRGYARAGETFLTDSGLRLQLMERTPDRHWIMQPLAEGSITELLTAHGHIPLPPYIRKGLDQPPDRERYQTVFAKMLGSVAAPTAGLHFTPALLDRLQAKGIGISRVTLHVGLGTFAPVKEEDPLQHKIHAEWCEVSEETVAEIRHTKQAGGKIIAVGTTTTRTLETAAESGELRPFRGESSLYIHPPYRFRVLDGLITNFHLPRTTLLLLVQSLAGSDLLRKAYEEAIRQGYRFYSYGDAMLIV